MSQSTHFVPCLFQVYLQVRFIWRRSRLLLPTVQLGAICLACWVSVSRVSDNKHHWSDVVGGIILGAIGCILTVSTYITPSSGHMTFTQRHINVDATWRCIRGHMTCIPRRRNVMRSHEVYTTSHQRRCNVMTLHRRWSNVIKNFMCLLG